MMPRGWRESHRSETGESQRGRPKLSVWKRKSCDNESSQPAVSPSNSYTYFEQKPSVNQTTDPADLAKSPTFSDVILNPVPLNTTGTLVNGSSTCSPVNLQSETTPTPHGIHDGESIYPSLVSASSSNLPLPTKATSPSSTKPLSLLPFLGGVPTNGGMAGCVALTSSVPQWMQFLNKQDVGEKSQDMSTGW